MSEAAPTAEQQHHPTTAQYLKVAVILAILTAIEFGVLYVPALRPVVVAILWILSIAKFALVAMYFMHLRFDRRFLTAIFVACLAVALVVSGAVLLMSA